VVQIRVVEVLAALSLTTDLASGVPFEKGLRTCAVATAFARELGLPPDELGVVFHTALLRAIGCTSHASENGDDFGDDIAFQAWLKELDFGDQAMLSRQLATFGTSSGPSDQAAMRQKFLETAPILGPQAGDDRDLNRRLREVRLVGWAGRGSRHRRARREPGRGAGRRRTRTNPDDPPASRPAHA
jgi:hypothetical protein